MSLLGKLRADCGIAPKIVKERLHFHASDDMSSIVGSFGLPSLPFSDCVARSGLYSHERRVRLMNLEQEGSNSPVGM